MQGLGRKVGFKMSVEQTDVVDIVSVDKRSGHVVLTVSDHLDWSDSLAHQRVLQEKLNSLLNRAN